MSLPLPALLMIDDDPGLRRQFKWTFDQYSVNFAADREEAIAQVRRIRPAVVTLDLGLPPDADGTSEGLRTLSEILAIAPETKVIAVTGQNERQNAVEVVARGAYDFIPKPIDGDLLGMVIARAFNLADLESEQRKLVEQLGSQSVPGLITRDPEMLKLCRQVEKLANANATVLLLGESGTGKELMARALHTHGSRRAKRFVAINCAAIPDALLESELFGYERGAFTGAHRQTPGKIETAHKGTLFLDEIGDLPMALQAKLLRFLQERVIERLGGREEIPVDVRVVCATHRNLLERIKEGSFREDLYYRLSELVIEIPPLRARVGDAVLLANALLSQVCEENKLKRLKLRPDAADAIERHPWPGNVRELENRIKRAVFMAEGGGITPDDLGLAAGDEAELKTLREVREEAERAAVLKAMARVDGNIARAAELLGISRPTLYDMLDRFGMRRQENNPA
ncbi:MAG: PEP-CTERM-box response regulator transcription factor [Burkholderiaceae bacterium]